MVASEQAIRVSGRDRVVTDVDILEAFVVHPDPALSAPEVAEDVEMSRQGVDSRLRELEEDGLVGTKKVGARARIWWITDRGRQFYANNS